LNLQAGTLENVASINTTGGLTKNSAGTLVLDGTNTWSGGTTVSNGTLILTNNEAIADGTSLTVGDPTAFAAPVVPQVAGGLQAAPQSAVAPVPEPDTVAILALSTCVAAVYCRLRRHRRRGGAIT
jgi:autotransporter-associated beta strand protein